MQRIATAVLAAVFAVVLWSGCNVESVAPDNTPKTITTTVAGQVVDESGTPVQGAQIAAYGKSAVTNQYGTFLIKGVAAPEERCLIKVSKSGYFDGYRAEQPAAGGVTQMRIGLMSNTPQGWFPASTGRTITAPGTTASVVFPANGYVTASGTAYTGQVSYVVRHLNPTAPNFFDFFAGDFEGIRADGSSTEMLSYGVLRVELHGSNGEKLNLADGKTATVSYPIPGKMTANAPAEMPLWSFDEAKGMWKEEGKATMQGNLYVGTVSHFSEWNCDDPARIAMVRVHVTCGSEGVAGVLVRIGERTAVTDTNGYASRRVPQGVSFTVKVHPEVNDGLESTEIAAGPYAAGTNNQLDLPLTVCPAYIKGDVYDCGDSPIDGTIIAEFSGGGFTYGFAQNGGFRFRVKSGVAITLKAISPEGKESDPAFVPPLNYGQEFDAGVLHACTSSGITASDYDLNKPTITSPNSIFGGKTLITADGSRAFVFYAGTATIVNTATGDIIRTITYSNAGNVDSVSYDRPFDISADGSLMLVGVTYGKYALYDANSGTKLRDIDGYYSMSLSPDGATLAAYRYSNRQDYFIATIDASTGTVIKEVSSIAGEPIIYVSQMTDFLTNTTFGVSLGKSGTLQVLNIADFSVAQTIPLQLGYVITQSPDGSVIGTNNSTGIIFYNTQSALPLGTVSLGGPQNGYDLNIGIAPSNDRIVGQLFQNSKYSAPSFFAISTGQLIKPLPSAINIRYYGLQFSADGKKLVGVYAENNRLKLRVWNF